MTHTMSNDTYMGQSSANAPCIFLGFFQLNRKFYIFFGMTVVKLRVEDRLNGKKAVVTIATTIKDKYYSFFKGNRIAEFY